MNAVGWSFSKSSGRSFILRDLKKVFSVFKGPIPVRAFIRFVKLDACSLFLMYVLAAVIGRIPLEEAADIGKSMEKRTADRPMQTLVLLNFANPCHSGT